MCRPIRNKEKYKVPMQFLKSTFFLKVSGNLALTCRIIATANILPTKPLINLRRSIYQFFSATLILVKNTRMIRTLEIQLKEKLF